jgi:hypothetical protein
MMVSSSWILDLNDRPRIVVHQQQRQIGTVGRENKEGFWIKESLQFYVLTTRDDPVAKNLLEHVRTLLLPSESKK